MSSFYNIYNWYWKVLDSSPGTQVFSSASGGFVLLSDPTYTAWLAADGGNIPTEIPTLAGLYEGVFNAHNERAVRPAYKAMTISTDTTLTNPLPSYLVVTPTVDNLKLIMPQSNKPGSLAKGQTIRIKNGAAALTRALQIYANDGTTQIWGPTAGQQSLAGGEDLLLTQTANDSVNGALSPQAYLSAAGGKLFGNLNIGTIANPSLFIIKPASGGANAIYGFTGAAIRWKLELGHSGAESGGNAGSDLVVSRYNDAGTLIGAPLTINRANGAVAIQGTPTNTSPAAGFVGEYLEHNVGTGVALTTGTWAQIATLTLPPGDWDVWGVLQYDGGSTTTVSAMQASIKTTSASPDFTQGRYAANSLPSAGTILPFLPTLMLPATQWLVASNTPIFLNTAATFGVAAMNAKGRLMARRRS